jgi:hypothetical protein
MAHNDFILAPLIKCTKKYIFSYIIFLLLVIFGISLSFYLTNQQTFCCNDKELVEMVLIFFIIFFAFIVSRCICIKGNKTEDTIYFYENNTYYNE